jgi:branched-chain amino acid transport system permease protein
LPSDHSIDATRIATSESRRSDRKAAVAVRGSLIAACGVLVVAAALTVGITHGSCPSSAAVWTRFALSGLILGFIYAMIALGYSMVYGVLQMLNFAHSEVFMVGSFTGLYTLSTVFGFGQTHDSSMSSALFLAVAVAGALITAALVSALMGVAIERIAYRPLRRRGVSRLGYLITAIGVSLVLQNVFLLLDGQRHLGLPFDWPRIGGRNAVAYPETIHQMPVLSILGVPITNQQVLVVAVAIVMLLVLDIVVRRTHVGQQIRAVAEDVEASSLLGVNIDKVIVLTFFIGGTMAGVAGTLYGIYYGQAQFNMGFVPGIKAFTAAVLGGIGSVRGAMLGGVLLGLIENLGVGCVGVEWQGVITFAVLVLVLMFRPAGILGDGVRQ